MIKVNFRLINGQEQSVQEQAQGIKLLSIAVKSKIPIRFGCASGRCGTCAVRISKPSAIHAMMPDEKALLDRMGLESSSGEIRLSCRSKISGHEDFTVDLAFQDQYDPAENQHKNLDEN